MTCRHVGQLLDAFADGCLSPALLAEVHAHLLQCPACQQQVEMLRACEDVISKDVSEPRVSPGFADRVLDALPTLERLPAVSAPPLETRRQRRLRMVRAFVRGALPAAAAVLFFSITIWPPQRVHRTGTHVAGRTVWASDRVVPERVREVTNVVDEAKRDAESLGLIAAPNLASALKQTARQAEPAAARAEPKPKAFSPTQFLWEPFDRMLQPVQPETSNPDTDGDIVRF